MIRKLLLIAAYAISINIGCQNSAELLTGQLTIGPAGQYTAGNTPLEEINFGRGGLLGHNYLVLDIITEFSGLTEINGVKCDYIHNRFEIMFSDDGINWGTPITVADARNIYQIDPPIETKFARMLWQKTSGYGIHAQFVGGLCTDIDECDLNTHNCNVNAFCTNTDGSFTCECNEGYEGDGVTCTDIDECLANTFICDMNANCVNNIGSYSCECNNGYSDSEEFLTGQLTGPVGQLTGWNKPLEEINFGRSGLVGHYFHELDIITEFSELPEINGVKCDYNMYPFEIMFSDDGINWGAPIIVADALNIYKIDPPIETKFARMLWQATDGSNGFHAQFVREVCTDIDECDANTHNCNVNAFCTNTDGSFTCEC
eukprot:195062_1